MSTTSTSLKNKIRSQKSGYGGTDLRKAFLSINNEPLEDAVTLPIARVKVNQHQPRQAFNEERLQELAEDIGKRGVLQPILVRPNGEDSEGNPIYQVIAGERRRRAAERAGLNEIPAIIYHVDEQEARAISLVENLQRVELEAIDEKVFYEQLQAEYNLGIKDIAALIHKSENYVRNRLNAKIAAVSKNDLIEREALDSEISNNNSSQEGLLKKSQKGLTNSRLQAHYNPAAFKRFTITLDATALALENGTDEQTRSSIRENLVELEKKIAELKSRLQ